jgi:hypothetical protein
VTTTGGVKVRYLQRCAALPNTHPSAPVYGLATEALFIKDLAATAIQQILSTTDEDKKTDRRLYMASVRFQRCHYNNQKLGQC